MKKNKPKVENTTDELLRTLVIVNLGLAGLGQEKIRKIVGGDIHRVNRIVKHLKGVKK